MQASPSRSLSRCCWPSEAWPGAEVSSVLLSQPSSVVGLGLLPLLPAAGREGVRPEPSPAQDPPSLLRCRCWAADQTGREPQVR